MTLSSFQYGDYTDDINTQAVLMSAAPFISLDQTHWTSVQSTLESKNFTCTEDTSNWLNYWSCSRAGSCNDIIIYMADILMDTSFINLEIPPSTYLIDDFTAGTCNSLITANDANLFVLGEPFFRTYNVKLNYLTTEISIYTPTK